MRTLFFCSAFICSLLVGTAQAADPSRNRELYQAAMFQDLPRLEALLAQGADPNHVENGRPTLGWAAQNGNVEIVRALLKGGANPNAADIEIKHTPLIRAIEMQHLEIVQALLKGGADPNAVAADGKTALMFAVESQKPALVQALLDAKVDVKRVEEDGNSPVLVAAQEMQPESIEIIRLLGKAGAELNASTIIVTPLVYAVEQGNAELVEVLLAAGADPNRETRGGKTPLAAAVYTPELLRVLLKNKADPNLRVGSATPLSEAILNDNAEAVEILLESGADPDLADPNGTTPLQLAEQNFKNDILEMLRAKSKHGSGAPSAGGAAARGSAPDVPITKATLGNGSLTCSIVDAAQRHMELHGILQKNVDAGKLSSEIFRTYNDDTADLARMYQEDPSEACLLFERLRIKYGV